MIYTWNLDPVAFSLFGLDVRWYGISYLVAFLFANYGGFWIYQKFFRTQKSKKSTKNTSVSNTEFTKFSQNKPISRREFEDFVFYGFFSGIAGGRLGYFLFYNPQIFWENPLEILKIWHGGMSIHGGILAVVFFGIFWAKKQKISFWHLADIFVFPLTLGLAMGRMANFMNGELAGRATNQTWGVIFPHVDAILRHPSQLYEAGKNLILALIIFLLLQKGFQKKPGMIFAVFLVGYGIFRFFIEFFREPEIFVGTLTMGQILCGIMVILGIFILSKKNHS